MRDQAALLRQMGTLERCVADSASEPGPPTIVVASGKGGVGKSVVSILLAKLLSDKGRRVLLFEGNQNLGSLHVLLGVRRAGRLEALVNGELSPSDLLTQVTNRLWLLSGDSGAEALYGLGEIDRARLHQRLINLYDNFDVVVIDSSQDLQGVVRVATIGATRMFLLTVPEPAALIDAYAVLKTVHLRVPTLPIDVLVNRVDNSGQGRKAHDRLATAARRFLEYDLGYLGALPEDDVLRVAVRTPGALLRQQPNSSAVQLLRKIVEARPEVWEVATTTGA